MTESVVFDVLPAANDKKIGIATLNVEKKLNSLTQQMVMLLTDQLIQWEQDDSIVCIWLQGAGEKAFCAGGDVRCLRDRIAEVGPQAALPYVQSFFENEYRLDYLIHCYSKPIICWGHGIVMGGGIGLMSGASYRVVTETSRLAMPEITIGLYPDVGGTWFLNHAPGRTGLFLGLTGANFNAADAMFVGMADRFIPSMKKQSVLDGLQKQAWTDCTRENEVLVGTVLRSCEVLDLMPAGNVRQHYDVIQAVTDADSAAGVAANILAIDSDEKWLQKAAATLKSGCPSTAHLVFEQLRRGKKLSLPEVFQMELVMSLQCALHPDFPEGVRALLVDKDGAPQWQHQSVAEVSPQWVEEHFQAPWPDGVNPLQDLAW
ncbi:MAG: enoyl-CoA hydratase [Alcanivorax sp.]|nr:MAG: enoyl-CoA hydratase [Alcanivorax sp.]